MRSRHVLALAGVSALAGVTAVAGAAGGAAAAQRGPAAQGGAAARGAAAAQRGHAAGAGPSVSIRIEGGRKTLLLPEKSRGRSGSITKYGAPRGKCPGASAQGVLDRATHGHWKGTWSTSFNEYFVTSILGEAPPDKHHFWEIFVNDKAASVGACEIKLHRGERLLFVDETGSQNPAELKAPRSVTAGTSFTVKLVGFNAHGDSKPLAGVKVTGRGIQPATTNSRGVARVSDSSTGELVLRASPRGYVRAEAEVRLAHR